VFNVSELKDPSKNNLAKNNVIGVQNILSGNASNILTGDSINNPIGSSPNNPAASSTGVPTGSPTGIPASYSKSIPTGKTTGFSAANLAKSYRVGRTFIDIILKRLYYLIVIPAVYITYNVLKALTEKDEKGQSILDNISDIIAEVVNDIMDISDQCPALIGDFPRFLDCLGF
jgi:hypothetical protein